MKNLKQALLNPANNIPIQKIFLIVLLPSLLLLTGCGVKPEPVLQWIGIHSLKGELYPREVSGELRGGLSLISGYLNQYKQEPLVFATNGTIHGSPQAYLSKGQTIIEGLNAIGLDALFVDSRELYFGSQRLSDLAGIANFPLVASNIRDIETGKVPGYLSPYYYHMDSQTLFIGLASPLLLERNLPENVRGLELLPLKQAVRDGIEAAHENSIKFSHLVLMAVGYKADRQSSNSFIDEALSIPEVSILVIGERDLDAPRLQQVQREGGIKHILMLNDSLFDGAQTLDLVEVRKDFSQVHQDHLVVRSGAISPDPEIGAAIFRASAPVEELLRDQITNSTQKINHSAEQESPLANLVLDACRDYWDVDVALINSGALRGSLGPGVITLADLYKSLPFEGTVVLAKITGSLLVEVLKKSGKFWGDPQRNNGFLQVSGLTARFFQINSNLSLDIDSIRVGGKALEMDKEYTLAVERYLFSGGDGYDEFSKAEIISDTMVSSLSVLLQTLRGRSVIDPVSDGRIVIE